MALSGNGLSGMSSLRNALSQSRSPSERPSVGAASPPFNPARKRLISAPVLDLRCGSVLRRRFGGRGLVELRDLVALEIHRDAPRVDVPAAALLQVVDIIPTFLVETVGHHRRAEQVAYLAARHAGFDLFDRRLVQEIALLDIDAVDASRRQRAQGNSEQKPLQYFRQSGAQPLND